MGKQRIITHSGLNFYFITHTISSSGWNTLLIDFKMENPVGLTFSVISSAECIGMTDHKRQRCDLYCFTSCRVCDVDFLMFSEIPDCSFYKTSHLVMILLTFLKSLHYFKLALHEVWLCWSRECNDIIFERLWSFPNNLIVCNQIITWL